ncbi:glycerophosphodiester phosphodiesterase [Haemophilus influenzae 3655]|uniref:Glycerophosphodiester phosphodiesterase n=1 Tax=Haemophilus influenzae (strain NTHi 3655) TaxID=375177 RepID=A0A0H3PD01_HAEI3|nr:glycerophosphodiester phosphodiesterase [Haemophilus influenzae 3655]
MYSGTSGQNLIFFFNGYREIELIQGSEKCTGRKVGIYPEIKAAWFRHQYGKDMAYETLKVLKKDGYYKKTDMVY